MTKLQEQLTALAKDNREFAQLMATVMASQSKAAPKRRTKSKGRAKPAVDKSPEATAQRKVEFAAAAIVAATERGFADVIPNETILTFGKWDERGFTVKKGEKSIRVKTKGMRGKGIPLFHKDQVEPKEAVAA